MDSEEIINKVYNSIIEQEQFKEWFNDSKVVQDNKPLIVYHGTGSEIDKFKQPAFFTPDKESSAWFAYEGNGKAKVIAAILCIENPIVLETKEDIQNLEKILNKYNIETNFLIEREYGQWEFYWDFLEKYAPDGSGSNYNDVIYIPEVREALIEEGYDGLYSPYDRLCNGEIPIYVTFFSEQIRIIGQIDI